MARRPKAVKKTEMIQVMIEPEVKKAFDAWCAANSTTMSEVLRRALLPYAKEGKELLDGEIAGFRA